jgi:hypothetical protein
MKPLPLCAGLACVLLFAGCATSTAAHRHPPHEADIRPSPASQVLIISATYGSGKKFADVTERVNDLLRQPNAHFWAKPKWLGADPTPGWNKALVIVYEVKGRRRTFTAGEGGTVSIARLLKNKE